MDFDTTNNDEEHRFDVTDGGKLKENEEHEPEFEEDLTFNG